MFVLDDFFLISSSSLVVTSKHVIEYTVTEVNWGGGGIHEVVCFLSVYLSGLEGSGGDGGGGEATWLVIICDPCLHPLVTR